MAVVAEAALILSGKLTWHFTRERLGKRDT